MMHGPVNIRYLLFHLYNLLFKLLRFVCPSPLPLQITFMNVVSLLTFGMIFMKCVWGRNMTVTSSVPDVCTWERNEVLHVNCSWRTGTFLLLYIKVMSCVFFCLCIVNDFNLLLPTNAQLLLIYFIYSLKLTAIKLFLFEF